ncbi:MAG: phage holin family protein [Burkholderiaceae bacterium]|nr:phage holin family protein [Aquabacterium sp.]NUP87209.1 phage holin family protein [Burkholderiaceae bacterium]
MTQTAGGVSGPVRRLGASLLALGRIRLELLAIEVQEEKERVTSLLLWSVVTAMGVGFAALFVAFFVTVALWDTPHRLVAPGVAAALFIGLVALGALRMRRIAAEGSMLFRSSVEELLQDSALLRRGPTP